jgi:hypothetical protein|nr:MAG TPA: hypothetical protein [Caudoviricetes sp.]
MITKKSSRNTSANNRIKKSAYSDVPPQADFFTAAFLSGFLLLRGDAPPRKNEKE